MSVTWPDDDNDGDDCDVASSHSHSAAKLPPWRVYPSKRQALNRTIVAQLLKQTDAQLARADAWLSPDGVTVVYAADEAVALKKGVTAAWTPLLPGRTVLKHAMPDYFYYCHHELYIGAGLSAGIGFQWPHLLTELKLTDLTVSRSVPIKWRWKARQLHPDVLFGRAALQRAFAAFGGLRYCVFTNNCHHVTAWLATGARGGSDGANAATGAAVCLGVLLVCLIVFAVLLYATTRPRRHYGADSGPAKRL